MNLANILYCKQAQNIHMNPKLSLGNLLNFIPSKYLSSICQSGKHCNVPQNTKKGDCSHLDLLEEKTLVNANGYKILQI